METNLNRSLLKRLLRPIMYKAIVDNEISKVLLKLCPNISDITKESTELVIT